MVGDFRLIFRHNFIDFFDFPPGNFLAIQNQEVFLEALSSPQRLDLGFYVQLPFSTEGDSAWSVTAPLIRVISAIVEKITASTQNTGPRTPGQTGM